MATAREHAFAGFPAALSDTARAALERAAAPVAPSAVLAGGVAAASAACDAAARRLRVPSLVLDADASRGGEQEAGAAPIVQPKLSKKQKRAAHQQRKRDSLCGNVVATGDPAACPYGDRCKFSHDVEAYRARKPADLPGRRCPFERACSLGRSIRARARLLPSQHCHRPRRAAQMLPRKEPPLPFRRVGTSAFCFSINLRL